MKPISPLEEKLIQGIIHSDLELAQSLQISFENELVNEIFQTKLKWQNEGILLTKDIIPDLDLSEQAKTIFQLELDHPKEVNLSFYLHQYQKEQQRTHMKELLQQTLTNFDQLDEKSMVQTLLEQQQTFSSDETFGLKKADEVIHEMEFGEKGKPIPLFSKPLTKWTKGFHKSEPNCILAGTGEGKTLFMCNSAISNVLDHGLKVMIISQEMKKLAVMKRILAALSEQNQEVWQEYNCKSHEEFLEMKDEAEKIVQTYLGDHFEITDQRLKLSDLLKLIRYAEDHHFDVIYCDYFQLIQNDISPKSVQGYERDAQTSMMIKDALLSTNLAWVWLSQITKDEFAKRDPKKAAVRGTKQLENDCATMILLYRKPANDEEEDLEPKLNAWVMKARHGEKHQETELAFDGAKQKMGDLVIPDEKTMIRKHVETTDTDNYELGDFGFDPFSELPITAQLLGE